MFILNDFTFKEKFPPVKMAFLWAESLPILHTAIAEFLPSMTCFSGINTMPFLT
jgi:hypothetical protein